MALPAGNIKSIQTTDSVVHEIIPERLKNSGYELAPPTLSSDTYIGLEENTIYNIMSPSSVAGSSTSGSYLSVRWYASGVDGASNITTPYNGMKVLVKIPRVGVSTAGVVMSINGNTNAEYHPVALNVNSVLTSHFAVNSMKVFVYDATATMTCYLTSNTATTVTGVWKAEANYDSNTTITYGTLAYYFRPYAAETIYRYKFVMLDKDNRLVPLTTTNVSSGTAVTNQTPTASSFRPEKIYWYNTTTTINAGNPVGGNTLVAIGYNANSTSSSSGGGMAVSNFNETVPAYRMIYLCGTYDRTTGLFTLRDGGVASSKNYYKFVPTNTANITLSSYFTSGYDYILLGGTYSSNTYIHLMDNNPMYHFDGTNLVPYDTYNDNRIEASIPTVNNNTITLTQGGVTKGSFTLNQNSDTTIDLDEGGAEDYNDLENIPIENISSGTVVTEGVYYKKADESGVLLPFNSDDYVSYIYCDTSKSSELSSVLATFDYSQIPVSETVGACYMIEGKTGNWGLFAFKDTSSVTNYVVGLLGGHGISPIYATGSGTLVIDGENFPYIQGWQNLDSDNKYSLPSSAQIRDAYQDGWNGIILGKDIGTVPGAIARYENGVLNNLLTQKDATEIENSFVVDGGTFSIYNLITNKQTSYTLSASTFNSIVNNKNKDIILRIVGTYSGQSYYLLFRVTNIVDTNANTHELGFDAIIGDSVSFYFGSAFTESNLTTTLYMLDKGVTSLDNIPTITSSGVTDGTNTYNASDKIPLSGSSAITGDLIPSTDLGFSLGSTNIVSANSKRLNSITTKSLNVETTANSTRPLMLHITDDTIASAPSADKVGSLVFSNGSTADYARLSYRHKTDGKFVLELSAQHQAATIISPGFYASGLSIESDPNATSAGQAGYSRVLPKYDVEMDLGSSSYKFRNLYLSGSLSDGTNSTTISNITSSLHTHSNKSVLDNISSQTAYTSKGTSTKVPTITTNTSGQVTAITETAIDFPVTSINGSTGAITNVAFNNINNNFTTNQKFGGSLEINSNGSSWSEGIRIHPASNNWSGIVLCEVSNSGGTGTSAKTWSMHNNEGTFGIFKNGSNTSAPYYITNTQSDGNWDIKGANYRMYYNTNTQSIDFTF